MGATSRRTDGGPAEMSLAFRQYGAPPVARAEKAARRGDCCGHAEMSCALKPLVFSQSITHRTLGTNQTLVSSLS
jgi:hypothetical protein